MTEAKSLNDEVKSANTAQDKQFYRITIAASIDAVWSQLVKTDEMLPFFFGSVCDCKDMTVGAPFAMRSPNGKYTSVVGEVLDFSPPYRYSHTFKFTNYDDAPCTVTYELKEVESGVEFTLITENVPAGTKTESSMAQGGSYITNNLKSVVETGKATFSGKLILFMIGITAGFTPKQCLSEHWQLDDIKARLG